MESLPRSSRAALRQKKVTWRARSLHLQRCTHGSAHAAVCPDPPEERKQEIKEASELLDTTGATRSTTTGSRPLLCVRSALTSDVLKKRPLEHDNFESISA